MERTKVSAIKKLVGKDAVIKGFVDTVRKLGKINFLLIRDISGKIQVVTTKDNKDVFKVTASLSEESVVKIRGMVKKVKQAPGGFEMEAKEIKILSKAEPELPIQVVEKTKKEASQTKRLDWRWLDLRKPKKQLILKVWTEMERAMREYFTKNDFIQIYTPKLMSTPSESGSELFELPYFKRKAFLAQSPQFYKQMAMAAGLEKVFEIGPVFRAEPSFTSRHSTEFTGYDTEISYIKSHQDVIKLKEEVMVVILKAVKEKYGQEIKKFYDREIIIPQIPFPQLTMEEVKKIIQKMGIETDREADLSPEEEKSISQYILKEKKHEFVFITDYPITVRPFYHMRYKDRPKLTKSFDLLWNGIEIATGAQREHRYKVLQKQAKEKGLNREPIKHYLRFFRYGCPPHGGFGSGPARMVMKMLNLENIREASFLYRGIKRLTP